MNGSVNIVQASKEGQRIDNYLFTYLKGVPKGLIYRLLRTGKIRVNGKRVKQTYRLQEDDVVKIPNVRTAESVPATISNEAKEVINSSIIFENEHFLTVNKPAGLAVHSGSKVSYGVIEILRALRPKVDFLELVHRLDRETSGCLLVAKNKQILNEFHELLQNHAVQKQYCLLVKGEWNLGEKTIDTPIQLKKGQRFDTNDQNNASKEAQTRFTPIKYFVGFTLLNAKIKPGRTHQIRIHAAQTGFPIVGDSKYGDFAFNRECKKMGLKRMFLHAAEISFKLFTLPSPCGLVAPLPDELKGFVEGLELRKDNLKI